MRSGETNYCADMTMELLGDRHQFNHTNGENRLNKAPPTQNFETHPNTFKRTSHLKSQLAANYSYDFIRVYKDQSLAFSMRFRRVYVECTRIGCDKWAFSC